MNQKIRIGMIAAGLVLIIAIVAAVIVTVGRGTSVYDSHMELAQQYLDDLQYEQAIAEYKAAIEIEPKNKEAYLALADIYVQQGDYEAALAVLNQGLEQTEAEELKVQAEEVSKQYEEVQALQAEQARKEEERKKEEAEKAKEAEYNQHMETAEQCIAEEEYEQALKEYETALKLYPDRVEIYSAMAELYVLMNDFEAAIDVLNQGIEKTEDEKLTARLQELQEQYAEIEKPTETENVEGEMGNSGNTSSGEIQKQGGEYTREETLEDGSRKVSYFNENGTLIKEEIYDVFGDYQATEYDVFGNETKVIFWFSDMSGIVWEYDVNGNLIKYTEYANGEVALWDTSEYDANDKLIGYICHVVGGVEERTVIEYDRNGNRVKDTHYEDGEERSYVIYEYDENRVMIKETCYDMNGNIIFMYDGEGNPIP